MPWPVAGGAGPKFIIILLICFIILFPQADLELDADETITKVRGRAGDWIEHIEIETSKGRILSAGTSAGEACVINNNKPSNNMKGHGDRVYYYCELSCFESCFKD